MQRDPHPGRVELPASSVNSYIYALNSPSNLTDPTGRFSFFEKVLIGIGAALAALAVVLTLPVKSSESSCDLKSP
mgnify:FL=1